MGTDEKQGPEQSVGNPAPGAKKMIRIKEAVASFFVLIYD
jgi:hypothetical protein